MRQEAFNHKNLQAIEGRLANGMSVMAMAAHTGCNTVYGSTPSNNPHPYPWMNSLLQDGINVGWLLGESFIVDHGRRSVIPERLADALMCRSENVISAREFYEYVHFSDAVMTDREILELPKAWVVGGDGGMGDIGYQNTSKVILQNRPNVKALMLDTQVYSNTGGQNSDSTPMLGGNDMNVFGTATQGKNTEKKTVANLWPASLFSAGVIANAEALQGDSRWSRVSRNRVLSMLHDLSARARRGRRHGADAGTACSRLARRAGIRLQPENGRNLPGSARRKGQPVDGIGLVRDEVQGDQRAIPLYGRSLVRHRGAIPQPPEEDQERRCGQTDSAREHAVRIMQQDVSTAVTSRSSPYIPDFAYISAGPKGDVEYRSLSRQLVLFCVERRKAWRMLQSKAGVENREYKAQRSILADVDAGRISKEDLFARAEELMRERVKGPGAAQAPGAHKAPSIPATPSAVVPPVRPTSQPPGVQA
jgi:pyruvate-ferredoxin/flavodoxin oxidoreductase